MATKVIPPGFSQVALQWRHGSYIRPAVNVFGIVQPDLNPQATAVEVADIVSATLATRMDNQVTFYSCRVTVGVEDGDPIVGEFFPDTPGGQNRSSLPPAMALRVVKTTGVGGRRGRGSMFLPWAVAEGNVDELGNVAGGEQSAWNAQLAAFQNGLSLAGASCVLLHAEGTSALPVPSPVLNMTVDPVISNQVRRQLRR